MLSATWNILCDSAIYILAGFLIAGLLQAGVNRAAVYRLLGQKRTWSVFLATLIGAPLPLCSCSVLPAALTLRKKGASKGAVISFLISTPETSVTSIALTYALLGPLMAVFRPLAACLTGITAGLIENFLDRRTAATVGAPSQPADQAQNPADCACDPRDEHGHAHADPGEELPPGGVRQQMVHGLRFAFVDLFDDLFGWIVLGIVAAAAIYAVLPEVVFQTVLRGELASMLAMLVVGVPLYVCAEASTPIAAALMLKGLNPGAALVLLLTGPATNIGSIGVLYRELGRRTIVTYLASIAVIALLMGGALNLVVARSELGQTVRPFAEELLPVWLKAAGAVAFLALGLFTAHRRRYVDQLAGLLCRVLPLRVSPRGLRGTAVLAAAVGYGFSGVTCIQPGELGIHTRFGAIVTGDLAPGLHPAWPWPIDRIDRVPMRPVFRTVVGFKPDSPNPHEPDTDLNEAWYLVGDENFVDLKCAVHWGAAEGQALRFQYGIEQPEQLVRAAARSAVREVLAGASINAVMTGERRAREEQVAALVRRRLDEYDSGIRIDALALLHAHAPPDVHAAFRDVASALEDRAALIDKALAQEARILPAARAGAAETRSAASAYATRVVALARGQAQRFADLVSAYWTGRDVTRERLYLEMLDALLPGVRKYIKPSGQTEDEIEIWFLGKGRAVPEMFQPDKADNR
ncbi:MAG: SO_0444 family Cu/Zn efflux transporter [Phycisphaerae bacterium]|jgi:hypothetical protein